MKVAYCLSGQPRFYKKGFENMFLNLLNNNKEHEIDTFIHFWFDYNLINTNFDVSEWNLNNSDKYTENTIEEIYKLYKPKKMLVEPPMIFKLKQNYDLNKSKQPTNITFSMYNSIYKSNELKKTYENENLFKYDLVIRCRFDWFFSEPIFFNNIDINNLYVPNGCETDKAFNDQFCIGNSHDMDIYSNLYNNIENYWYYNNIILANESLLYHHLYENKLIHKVNIMSHKLNFIRD